MMTLEEVHAMGTELEMWLRMRVRVIAVKMLKGKEQVPEGAITLSCSKSSFAPLKWLRGV